MKVGIFDTQLNDTVYVYQNKEPRLHKDYADPARYIAYEISEGNDFRAYHLVDGSVVLDESWTAPKIVPNFITSRQLRFGLLNAGITQTDVETLIASLPEPDKTTASIEWEYATEFDRAHPLVNSMGLMLGLTTDEIDDIYIYGASV